MFSVQIVQFLVQLC